MDGFSHIDKNFWKEYNGCKEIFQAVKNRQDISEEEETHGHKI